MNKKISARESIMIFFIGLAGNVAWAVENQYYNVFIYNSITPEPLYVSYMVAASALVATLTAIIMGAYTDVKGKRKPFLLFGFIFWTITTAIFPTAALLQPVLLAILVAIIFDCVMTFFGATAYEATFNAYVTDITTKDNRGKAIGILQLTMLISTLLTYGISGFIILAFGYFFFFYFVGFIVGIFGITGAILAKEPIDLQPVGLSVYEHLKNTFKRENIKNNKDCFLVLTGASIWVLGLNIFFPFILIYLQHYVGLSLETASFIVFIAFFIALITAYPVGILIDKVGRKKVAIFSVIFDSIALLLFAIGDNFIIMLIAGLLTLIFMSSWNISANTWIKDLFPEESRGQFSGYFILFTVLFSQIPGSLIGGWLSTEFGIPTIIEGQAGYVPTPIIFIVASFVMIIAIIPLIRAKEVNKK